MAIKSGGIIDNISDVINDVLKNATNNNLIKKGTANLIKKGKNAILDTVSTNIEDEFLGQVDAIEKVSKYISNWKNYYSSKNMDGMEKEYKKLKTQIEEIIPLESTITEARKIENMHKLLKNKGINYNLSEEEKQLAKILV